MILNLETVSTKKVMIYDLLQQLLSCQNITPRKNDQQ